ncbi:phage integrase central domain-containing protein, partial [Mycobacterium intracellulare]|uniref:phage integrase central domain-containing protein n=1 Tax=Mycobacterium intracellulare TaxID=1767 RepID=UPI00109E9C8F
MAQQRRTKGDGGLYRRSDGTWIGVVELPPSEGRRQRRRVASRDRNEAVTKLKKLRADVDAGRIAVTANTTIAKWLDRWLDEIHAEKIRPTTRRDYRTSIDRHIVPAIGTKRLDKLTTAHIRAMHQSIGSRRAAEKAHVILKKALGDAVREGMLTDNVATRIDAPKYRKPKRTGLSVELAQRIIAQAFRHGDISRGTRWAAAFLTGCRQSELLGLTWDCVDFDNGYIHVRRQLQQLAQVHGCGEPVAGAYPCGRTRPGYCPQARWNMAPDFDYEPCHKSLVWTQTKTAAGERFVPIVAPLLARLLELKSADGHNPHNLVWHRSGGKADG